MRELEHQQLPAGLERAPHGRECGGLVGDVAQAEADGDAIEGRVGKRQALRIRLHEGDIADDAGINEPVASVRQHGGVDVAQHDEAARAHLTREPGREISASSGDIERALPGTQVRQCEREALPQPMGARRHEVVHQIVVVGDRVEHATHAARLLGERHALEAEVGGWHSDTF